MAGIQLRASVAIVAHGAIGSVWIAAHAGHRVTGTSDVALVERGAGNGSSSDACSSLASIHLRAGIVVGASRAIGRFGVRGTRVHHTGARFGRVASVDGSTTNRTSR